MNSKVFGSGLLIAGTCIGAVTIVLPLSLLPLGSVGVVAMLTLTALLVYLSAAFVFEVSRSFPRGTDLAAMASSLIAPWAGKAVQFLFCLLLYCLLAAYMAGGAALIAENGSLHNLGIIAWAVLGFILLVVGIRAQDLINRFLICGLLICYAVFLISSAEHVSLAKIAAVPYVSGIKSIAVLSTAFGFHVIIPSLRDYMGDEVIAHKQALIIGLAVPFLLYLVWCLTLYGLLPYKGELGLLKLSHASNSFLHISDYLYKLQPSQIIPVSVFCFMLTSILSSYIGIALSLFQSLGRYCERFKLALCYRALLVLIPPALFAIIQPNGFVIALQYAAIIIAIISLLLPVVMVYKVRQKSGQSSRMNLTLLLIVLYAFMVVYSGMQ